MEGNGKWAFVPYSINCTSDRNKYSIIDQIKWFPVITGWIVSSENSCPPETSDFDFFLESLQKQLVSMRSDWMLGCKSNHNVLIRRGKMHTGKKVMWWWKQRLEWPSYKQRNAKDFWQPPDARRESRNSLLQNFQNEPVLLIPWFQT